MKNTLSYLVFALVASTSSLAFGLAVADPCATVTCADGEVCEIRVQDDECVCAERPGGEGDPAPCECEPTTSVEQAVCVTAPPADCTSDEDCSGEDVCVTYSYGSCSGSTGSSGSTDGVPACDPDEQGCEPTPDPQPEPNPEPCTVDETESICVPKYAAPCTAAADCGAGFTCETPEICTCTTGGPVVCDTEEGSECPDTAPDEGDCSCAPSEGDAYCQLIPVECTSDTDCQPDATCQSQYGGEDRAAIACEPDTNCDVDPIPDVSYCIPNGYRDWAENGGTDHVDGRQVESAERTSFFGNGEELGGGGAKASCSVSQGPTGFAAGSLLLLGMMLGFRRKKK